MIRILHTADVQIDATLPELGVNARRRRGDLLHTFEHLVALAIREQVHLFLVSGNLFATPRPDESAIQRVSTALRRLTARGILPVLLPGDCDGIAAPDSVYFREAFRNLLVLDGRDPGSPHTVRVAGRTLHLYGFCQRGEQPLPPERLRLDEEGCHIALMCFSTAVQIDETWLARISAWGFDYLACAPHPQWQTIETPERIYGCIPGSPEGYALTHTGDRFAALVHLDGNAVRVERRRVNRRRVDLLELDLDDIETPESLEEAVLGGASADLVRRVELRGLPRFAIDSEGLHKRCAGAFFHLDIRDRAAVLEGAVARGLSQASTSIGEFIRRAETMCEELPAAEQRLVEEAVRVVLAARLRGEGGGHAPA